MLFTKNYFQISIISLFFPNHLQTTFSNHWLSCIVFNSEEKNKTPEGLMVSLLEKNIESRPLWKPMHLQPIYKTAPYYGKNISRALFENGLCLPSGSNLTDTDKDFIANSILNYLNS